jgi:hypothetical protein
VADGNSPDPDDIGANAVVFGLLGRSGLQDRLVHFSHSCDLNPLALGGSQSIDATNEQRRQDYLHQTAGEGISFFGPFSNLIDYYNCRADQTAAVNDLRDAINASSASDPLWIIEAGEPDIIGYALQAANPAAIPHVHVVSHHPANDNSGDFFTWQQILNFGVTEHQIGDQNVGLQVPISSGLWDWAEGNSASAIVWILDQLKYAEADGVVGFQDNKYDCSDAGMVYWWLTGANGIDGGGNNVSTPVEIKAMLLYQPGAEAEPAVNVLAGWDNFDNAATPTVTTIAAGVTATAAVTGPDWSNNDGSGRGSSKDTTWGTDAGPAAADAGTTGIGVNLTLTNGASTGGLTFTITNGGAIDLRLNSFHMDALAFRPNAARSYALNVVSGDMTIGNVFTSAAPANDNSTNAITHLGGGLLTDDLDTSTHNQHDDIDIDLTGLPDHTLAPGESAVIQIAFSNGTGSGGGHHLFLDNVAFNGAFEATTVLLGDVDLSGTVDFLDISPFISVLSGGGFQAEADCDQSGTVDFLDISPFIAILSGS